MAAPTFVASYSYPAATESVAATITLTCSSGDVLVCIAATEDNGVTFGTPTGGTGLTWTLQQSSNLGSYAKVYAWTATASAANTAQTISLARSGGSYWGSARIVRFSGSDGIGASSVTSSATSGTPSLALTTTQVNSAVVVEVGDWNAVDAATRTWRTINGITPTSGNGLELSYARDASLGTALSAYWNDAGAAGSVTTGLTAPGAGWKWSAAAVEVLGTAGGGGPDPVPRGAMVRPSAAVVRSAVW